MKQKRYILYDLHIVSMSIYILLLFIVVIHTYIRSRPWIAIVVVRLSIVPLF